MKKFLAICIFLGLTISAEAQNTIVKGKIVNAQDGSPLSYANIIFENYKLGTSSNKNGIFAFKIPDSLLSEKVTVSYVGYFKKTIALEEMESGLIRMKPKTENLDEVNISQLLNEKTYTYRPSWRKESVGIGNLNAGLYPSTIARFYAKPGKFENDCFLKEIQIYFYDVEAQEQLSPKFRLHIYNVDENGMPGEDIVENIILEKESGKSSLKLNLLNRKIKVPESGFYIGLEHLFITENKYSEIKNYYINDSLVAENFAYERYAPVFKGVFSEPETAIRVYFFENNKWVNISHWDLDRRGSEANYVTPVFKIKITN